MANDMWLNMVESYTRYRTLTLSTDKLPAIAGVASTLHKFSGDRYLSGIWETDWARGVPWQIWESTTEIPSRTPSWSWVRCGDYLAFEWKSHLPRESKHAAELIGHDIRLTGSNRFGEVLSGSLRIRTWVTGATLDDMHTRSTLYLDKFPVDPYHKDIVQSFAGTYFTILLIGLFWDETIQEEPADIWKWGMLILEPANDANDAIYKRIGVAYHRHDTHGEFSLCGWTRAEITLI